ERGNPLPGALPPCPRRAGTGPLVEAEQRPGAEVLYPDQEGRAAPAGVPLDLERLRRRDGSGNGSGDLSHRGNGCPLTRPAISTSCACTCTSTRRSSRTSCASWAITSKTVWARSSVAASR